MKKIYALPLILLFLGFSLWLSAQDQTIKGTVTDAQDGSPLIGVNVMVTGTTSGTISDIDGKYSIIAPMNGQLLFTYVGYEDQTIDINNRIMIDVVLGQGVQLNEVVVTAMGMSKEKKALAYAVEQIDAEDIANSGKSDIVSALQGKVSGLQIQGSSGAPGAGASILIRGISSLDPGRTNRPLYIIDGIEVSDDVDVVSTKPGTANYGVGSNDATQGSVSNRMLDIDPNDIATTTVLKGAQATALYGVRAANGAIVITTKRGTNGDPTIDVHVGTGWNKVNKFPKVQTDFIDGHRGTSLKRSFLWDNWGAKVDSRYSGTQPSNIYEDFYQTGTTNTIGASIAAGSERFSYRLSSNFLYNEGVVPTSDYRRTNINLTTDYKVNDKFNIGSSIIYSNAGGNTPHEGRKSVANVIAYAPNTTDVNNYIDPYTLGNNFAVGIVDHPLFLAENNSNINNVNRILGSIKLGYQLAPNIKLNYALGIDNYDDNRERILHPESDEGISGVQNGPFGFITNSNIGKTSLTSNLSATFNKQVSDDLSISATVGQYAYGYNKKVSTFVGESFVLDNFYNMNNTLLITQSNSDYKYRNLAFYGELTAGYNDYLYFTLTGRNDRTSTLPEGNNSYFFPSASLALIVSDMVDLPDVISFAKLRGSWAKVGKDADLNQIGRYYQSYGNFDESTLLIGSSSIIGDVNLKPEFSTTIEVGGEFRLFNNRFGLDLTYYNTKTDQMILSVPISNATGAARFVTNAGSMTNNGYEVTSFVDILKDYVGIDWTASLNWSRNVGIIDEISTDADEIVIKDLRGVASKYVPGGKVGDLYASPMKRNEDGRLIIGDNGFPSMNNDTTVLMGNAMPDWIAGLNNDISYKGLGVSFLWEWKKGGDVIDITRNYSIGNGQLEETNGRHQEVVFDGVTEDGSENNKRVEITAVDFYRNGNNYRFAPEVYLQDASWVRLRNLSVYYNLPQNWLKSVAISKAKVTFTANNAFLNTPFKGWDPESNYFGPNSNVYGYLGLRTPQTKAFNIKLNLTF